jgi:hypothetical protein
MESAFRRIAGAPDISSRTFASQVRARSTDAGMKGVHEGIDIEEI